MYPVLPYDGEVVPATRVNAAGAVVVLAGAVVVLAAAAFDVAAGVAAEPESLRPKPRPRPRANPITIVQMIQMIIIVLGSITNTRDLK